MRERWLREGGRPFSHCRRNSTAMEKIGCHGGDGGDGAWFVRGWTLSGLITSAANFAAVARLEWLVHISEDDGDVSKE